MQTAAERLTNMSIGFQDEVTLFASPLADQNRHLTPSRPLSAHPCRHPLGVMGKLYVGKGLSGRLGAASVE